VEHRKADVRQAGYGAPGDDPARFLRELRQLRDGAGLGQAELAARAHYPYDAIKAAEVGPALPDLPVLSAYVRGCGGTTEEWEERWRTLTRTPSLPVSDARQSGRSDAATAGARINPGTQGGEAPDPSIIIAALSRVAEEMASPSADAAPTSPAARPLPDLPSPETAVPAGSPMSPVPHASSGTGWDPIRVSSAWPVLRHTPTIATAPASDAAVPWDAATPWDTAPETPSGTPGADGASADAAQSSAGAPTSGGTRAPVSGSASSPSRTRMLILGAVLLCVLVVLVAIFA
jgi:Helix-turn-helix domain